MSKTQSETLYDDEVDLFDFIKILWNDKKTIFLITSFVAICSLIYSLMLPNIYKAEALLAPSGDSDNSSISRMPNDFIGIASLAGFSLPTSGVSKVDLGLEVLNRTLDN